MKATKLFRISWYDESLPGWYDDTEYSCDTEDEAFEWFIFEFCAENRIEVSLEDVLVEQVGWTIDECDYYDMGMEVCA